MGTVEKIVSDPDREPYVDIVLKPSANLQHLDEVLVVTETSDQLPVAAQRDLAKSEAAGAEEVECSGRPTFWRKSCRVFEDPNAPQQRAGASGPNGFDLRPLKPLTAARPDRFSPSEVRPASQMTPGKAAAITPSQRARVIVTTGSAPVKRPKKPHPDGDGTISTDGSTKPAPHTNQDSFIIPGTATGPDRPLVNPENPETSAAIAPVAGTPSKEQHQ